MDIEDEQACCSSCEMIVWCDKSPYTRYVIARSILRDANALVMGRRGENRGYTGPEGRAPSALVKEMFYGVYFSLSRFFLATTIGVVFKTRFCETFCLVVGVVRTRGEKREEGESGTKIPVVLSEGGK